jgi:hypothetical protein
MSDRTGVAHGTLRPIIYFSRIPDMYIVMPQIPIGEGVDLAHKAYMLGKDRQGLPYKDHYLWCESGTLAEIDRLQKRLVSQELREKTAMAEDSAIRRERIKKQVRDAMRSTMISSSTSAWERDFIEAWFKLQDNKKDLYANALLNRNQFILAREYDSKTQVQDLIPGMV